MEDSVILNICEHSGPLQAMRIVGYIITIIKTLVPVIIIVTAMINFTKVVLDESDTTKEAVKNLITKIVIGAFIFFIPSLLDAIFDFVKDYSKVEGSFLECTSCMLDTAACQSKIDTAYQNEVMVALSKAEEALSKKEKALLEKEENDKKQKEVYKKINESNPAVINGSNGYGRGCTAYVPSTTYNASIAKHLIDKGSTRLGEAYVYGKWDCSAFMTWTISEYHGGGTAAGLGNSLKNKCVQANDVRPGDLFFSSRYNDSYTCTGCADTGRCDRWQCIMHIGMVYEVKDGKVTKILHNGSTKTGVEIRDFGYGFSPNSKGDSWVIQFSRPYA